METIMWTFNKILNSKKVSMIFIAILFLLFAFIFVYSINIKFRGKVNKFIGGYWKILAIVIFLGASYSFYYLYCRANPLSLTINNKNQLFDINESNYKVRGKASFGNIKIFINDTFISKIQADKKGDFEFEVEKDMLKTGWNSLKLEIKRPLIKTNIIDGAMINVLENLPDVYVPLSQVAEARKYGNEQFKRNVDYKKYISDSSYNSQKPYYDSKVLEESKNIRFDENNIPKVKYGDNFLYNPVTVIQHGLGLYKEYLLTNSDADYKNFINIVDWLCEYQREDGSMPYEFTFKLKKNLTLEKGFVSGMAQGQFLSILERAYSITKNESYLEHGFSALNFMTTKVDSNLYDGASKDLSDLASKFPELSSYKNLTLPEEYVTSPSSYVLNGDLFALIGLYDWANLNSKEFGSDLAKSKFDEGIYALEFILPYYDYYGWSSYDLLQYTYESPAYFTSSYAHHYHILLLDSLYKISSKDYLASYRDRFLEYNDLDTWRETDKLFEIKN